MRERLSAKTAQLLRRLQRVEELPPAVKAPSQSSSRPCSRRAGVPRPSRVRQHHGQTQSKLSTVHAHEQPGQIPPAGLVVSPCRFMHTAQLRSPTPWNGGLSEEARNQHRINETGECTPENRVGVQKPREHRRRHCARSSS